MGVPAPTEILCRTTLGTAAAAEVYRTAAHESFSRLEKFTCAVVTGKPSPSDDPFAELEVQPDFSAYIGLAHKKKSLVAEAGDIIRCTHLYVFDRQSHRDLQLLVPGGRGHVGKDLKTIVAALQKADPQLVILKWPT